MSMMMIPSTKDTTIETCLLKRKCVPEQSEVSRSLWEPEVVVVQTIVLLQQNGHGA